MASPPIVTKGVSKWSLNSDDNATADEIINWQEGQMPSTVNNSARAMMKRIREQYDLNQAQFKSILDTVSGRFGNKIKDITSDTFTITPGTPTGNWTITFQFNDKLTAEEYNAYKAGTLYLLTTLNAPGIASNLNYQTWTYNSIIAINLAFKVGNNLYNHAMQFKLNFFGIDKTNAVISFHELKEFVNCTTLQVGGATTSTNFVALPMKRTYMETKTITSITVPSSTGISTANWYYISPSQCICIHNLHYDNVLNDSLQFPLPVKKNQTFYLRFNNYGGAVQAYVTDNTSPPETGTIIVYYRQDGARLATLFNGNFTFMMTGTPTQLKDYPMILTPTVTNPYPIIV